jgi:hypothetical protein
MIPGDADQFPEDLSGHFWASLSRIGAIERWRFTIWDYQDNEMLTGLATSEAQAARIVRAWDAVIISEFPENGDPSLGWPEEPTSNPLTQSP